MLFDRNVVEAALSRHEGHAALQFSGGKDSLSCLYLLRDYLPRITVYWLNSGDIFPETRAVIDHVREFIPHFVEIEGNVHEVIAQHGLPSDIVPCGSTYLGQIIEPNEERLQDRYDCCYRTVMQPMHQRMHNDGITLLIRGQKNADKGKGPHRSGEIAEGVELLYPVEGWSVEEIFDYLRSVGAPISRVYESMPTTPECMCCSAWWEDGRATYMKKYWPDEFQKYQQRLARIRVVVQPLIAEFNRECKND